VRADIAANRVSGLAGFTADFTPRLHRKKKHRALHRRQMARHARHK